MSWSFSVIGSPAAIIEELGRVESGLSGASLDEFKEARPGIETLVRMNSNVKYPPVLHIDANGHASSTGGVRQYSQCAVHIRTLGVKLVTEAVAATEPATTT